MLNRKLFIESFVLAVLISILHYAALHYSLYWTLDWFDIIMHFLGGLWVAIFALFLVYELRMIRVPEGHKNVMLIVTFGSVLVVGLAWELWELLSGLTFVFRDRADTLMDIVMDLIGGAAGYWYGVKVLCQKN